MAQDQAKAARQSDSGNSASQSTQPAGSVGGAPIQAEAGAAAGSRDAVETVLWSGRTHWRHYAGRIGMWVLGNLLLSVLAGMLASRVDWLTLRGAAWIVLITVILSGGIVLGRVAMRVMGTCFRLTTQRLFIERGILSRTVDQTELTRVDDVRMHQTFLDRMLGVGSITLLTTDATDRSLTMEGVRDPRGLAETVRHQMRALRGKSVFVETL